jgi:hypothetical protein
MTSNVVSSNPANGDVYSIENYMIKFVSDLRQVGGFLRASAIGNRYIASNDAKIEEKFLPCLWLTSICTTGSMIV